MKLPRFYGDKYIEREEYKKAIEILSNSLKFNEKNYEMYYKMGVCYTMLNDFNIAKDYFQKTIELKDNMYLSYYRLAQISLLYREYDAAEENFLKSSYREKKAKAYLELAKIYIIRNDIEKAFNYINNAINIESSYYDLVQEEEIFSSIKKYVEKPVRESKSEFEESKEEKKIDKYLENMYDLTKSLNKNNSNMKK